MASVQSITWRERLTAYYYLCRFDKPIGTELVFWPTMWALWIASAGVPNLKILAFNVFRCIVYARSRLCN